MRWYLLFLLSGCSVFQNSQLSTNLNDATKNICLSSVGKGRLQIASKKYIFSYESALNEEYGEWVLVLNFPLRPAETFKLDWSRDGAIVFESSFDQKILRENQNINPQNLDHFTQGLGKLIQEVIALRSGKSPSSQMKWKKIKNKLKVLNRGRTLKGEFSKLAASGHCGLMQLSFMGEGKSFYKLELVVRECFDQNGKKLN